VLLGHNGTGFASLTHYSSGVASAQALTAADFNGDSKPDLVVLCPVYNNAAILLNNGSGAFGSPTTFTLGSTPTSVCSDDFNGDGKMDLAVANKGGNSVSVLAGNGNGTFNVAVNYTVGSQPVSIVSGDFNGDSKKDLAVANANSNKVSVLVGSGTGTFATAVSYAVTNTPYAIINADFNGDGKLDIATADNGVNDVAVLLSCATAGINQFANNTINVYPNPAQNNFTVEVSTNDKQTLQVYDVNGKQVLTQTITGTTNVDASNLTAGVYNISIANSIGVVNKRLVIVR